MNTQTRIIYSVNSRPLRANHPQHSDFDLATCIQSLLTGLAIIVAAGLVYGAILVLLLQVAAS